MSERLKSLVPAAGPRLVDAAAELSGPPASLSSAVALPHRLVYAASVNLRGFVDGGRDRRELRAEVARLEDELSSARARLRELELQNARYAETLDLRAAQSPGVVMSAPVVSVDISPLGERSSWAWAVPQASCPTCR